MSDLPEKLSDIADRNLVEASEDYNMVIRCSIHIRSAETHIRTQTARIAELEGDALLRYADGFRDGQGSK